MKHLALSTAVILASSSALAEGGISKYACRTTLPRGTAQVTMTSQADRPPMLTLVFLNEITNQTYSGRLIIGAYQESSGYLIAHGSLSGGSEKIAVSAQNTSPTEASGTNHLPFILYSGGNHAIDYGYGNPFSCKRVI